MGLLTWYELGLRLTQGIILFSQEEDGHILATDTGLHGALIRVTTVVEDLEADCLGRSLSGQCIRLARGCRDRWSGDRNSKVRARIGSELNLLKSLLSNASLDASLSVQRAWFLLGLEIADGIDLVWSEGRPTIQPSSIPLEELDPHRAHLVYSRLEFVDPQAPSWTWRDSDCLHEFLNQLGLTLSQVFLSFADLKEEDFGHLPEISLHRLWGWQSLEAALLRLKSSTTESIPLPRWDKENRSLYVGETVVHTFRNSAPHQTKILDAFQDQSWPSRIDNPFRRAKTQNLTIADLNKGIDPPLIVFRGDGTTGIRWELSDSQAAGS